MDGDDPGDATGRDARSSKPRVPSGTGRFTWEPERDRYGNQSYLKETGWRFPIYDHALGKVVAVCSEQQLAITLCNWLSSYDIEH